MADQDALQAPAVWGELKAEGGQTWLGRVAVLLGILPIELLGALPVASFSWGHTSVSAATGLVSRGYLMLGRPEREMERGEGPLEARVGRIWPARCSGYLGGGLGSRG